MQEGNEGSPLSAFEICADFVSEKLVFLYLFNYLHETSHNWGSRLIGPKCSGPDVAQLTGIYCILKFYNANKFHQHFHTLSSFTMNHTFLWNGV
jgi:hypothetical protein